MESIPTPIQTYFSNIIVNLFNAYLCAIKRHRFIFPTRLEPRRSFRKLFEEPVISELYAFQRLLQTPRIRYTPISIFRQLLKLCHVISKTRIARAFIPLALAIDSVMSTGQRNKMIVHTADDMQVFLQMMQTRMTLKFVFIGFHRFLWFAIYSLMTSRVTPPVDATNLERVHRLGNLDFSCGYSSRNIREAHPFIRPTIVLTDSVGGMLTKYMHMIRHGLYCTNGIPVFRLCFQY